MLKKGGSRLGGFVSSDFKEFDSMTMDQRASKLLNAVENLGIDGVIATGGDTSLNLIGTLLRHTGREIPFVGIPKTIDNDIPEVTYSIGFQTAVTTASNAIANIRDTAESHRRIIVVECMGRKCGYLTLYSGLASGIDTILIPEFPIDQDMLLDHVSSIYQKNNYAVIAVSESITLPSLGQVSTYTTADGSSRLGGSAKEIAKLLSQSLSVDARHIVLGHLQRGGSPNSYDQVLSTVLGAKAVSVLCDGITNVFVTQNGNQIDIKPLDKVQDVPSKSLRPDSPEVLAALSMGIYIGEVK
jgi:6-phosphofructokinase 1